MASALRDSSNCYLRLDILSSNKPSEGQYQYLGQQGLQGSKVLYVTTLRGDMAACCALEPEERWKLIEKAQNKSNTPFSRLAEVTEWNLCLTILVHHLSSGRIVLENPTTILRSSFEDIIDRVQKNPRDAYFAWMREQDSAKIKS